MRHVLSPHFVFRTLTSVTSPLAAKCSRSRWSVRYLGMFLTQRRDDAMLMCEDGEFGFLEERGCPRRRHALCLFLEAVFKHTLAEWLWISRAIRLDKSRSENRTRRKAVCGTLR